MSDLGPHSENTLPGADPNETTQGTQAVGSGLDRNAFAVAVLQGIGVANPSPTQVAMMLAWMNAEHSANDPSQQAAFNPLNTTLDAPGASNFNSFGPNGSYHVRNYPTWQAGVQATVATLRQGNFAPIVSSLRSSDGNGFVTAIGQTGWGTNPDAVRQGLGAAQDYNGPVGTLGTAGVAPAGTQGTAPAVPNAPPFDPKHPVADNPTLDQEIATNFPEYAWAFADPDLGPILRYAATYNENAAWVQAQVQGTNWWKQHSGTARQWQMLQQTDPAEALQQMHNKAAQVAQQAGQIGLTVAPDRANQLAQESLQFGWNDQQMQQALYAEFQRVSGGGQAMGVTVAQTGTADTYAQQATQMAHEYLSNLSSQQAQQIGMQIATGQMDPAALSSMFVGQAKARFKDNPDLMQALDSGITPAQVLAPYQQTIGNLLEIGPDQINFSDPKYAAVLSTTDQRGGNRLMTETEAATWARSQPEWARTQNARQSASQTAQQVLSDMGAARY